MESSGGTVGTAVLRAVLAPWNIFQNIELRDVNGAQLVGPFAKGGYSLYAGSNVWGGYDFVSDPASDPDYAATGITISFLIYVPLEYHKSGRGALPNQDSSAKYKLAFSLNDQATIWSTLPTANPTLRFRGYLDQWTMPGPIDAAGQPQAQIPPGYGTTGFWSSYSTPLNLGTNNIIPIRRVGNRIRNLVFAFYKAGVPATLAQMPDPVSLEWDQRVLHLEALKVRRSRMSRGQLGIYASGLKSFPTHVIAYPFMTDMQGHIGGMGPEMFLPTVQGTRLDAVFNIPGSGADEVEVIINDVAGAELDSSARFSEESMT